LSSVKMVAGTDMLLVITTSTGDELLRNVNVTLMTLNDFNYPPK